MIDFHCHVLPAMDDGAKDLTVSLRMLKAAGDQGIRRMIATPHFYAEEEGPYDFLTRRKKAYHELTQTLAIVKEKNSDVFMPEIFLGAEILFFPGMYGADELYELRMADTGCILIEPPMVPWTDGMLDEIVRTGKALNLKPIIAHVDRFMRFLDDRNLMDRVMERDLLVQVNASYFLHRDWQEEAMEHLSEGHIDFIGSDCHDTNERRQNMGPARDAAAAAGLKKQFDTLMTSAEAYLGREKI